MKKHLLIAICVAIAASVSAQNYTNKQFALIHYNLKITDAFREDIQHLDAYLESAKIHNEDADDRLKAMLIHHLYYNMERVLEKKLEISILPINSFMQQINYDDFGYPKASVRKAIRKGDFPFYFKLKIILDSLTESKREKSNQLPSDITYPHYTLDITLYNDEGILPVDRWHGESKPEEPLKADKDLFGGFTGQRRMPSDTNHVDLASLHHQAVMDMINSHLNE